MQMWLIKQAVSVVSDQGQVKTNSVEALWLRFRDVFRLFLTDPPSTHTHCSIFLLSVKALSSNITSL